MDAKKLNNHFAGLYKEFLNDIFRFCYIKTSNRELAKDISQQAFLKAYEYMKEGKEVQNFKVFIYQIARNLIIDHYRKKKPISLDQYMEGESERGDNNSDNSAHEPGYEDDIELKSEYGLVLDKMGDLPEKDKDLLLLRYVSGFSIKEIAEIYKERPNTISVQVHRALSELKKKYV